MTLIVIIIAIAQGLSEFLPISSSAHLLLIPWVFHWPDPGLGFDAAIHLGTAVALLIFFWRDFWKLLIARDKLLWYLLAASIPGATIGFLGDKWVEEHLHASSYAPLIVGIGLVLFSLILWYVDEMSKLVRTEKQLNLKQSLFIGFAQVLALIPGVSRSGITITAGRALGMKREAAARFSFLLATPITLGAGAYKLYELVKHPQSGLSGMQIGLGVVVSAIVGIAVIRWLLGYLAKHDMRIFVWYRTAIGLLVILIWLLR